MFKLLIEKELKNIIQSPKFIATFITCSLLIFLSVGIGINEYFNLVNQFNTAQNLSKTEMSQARSWLSLTARAFREPNPIQIFSAGINYDIGRYSLVNERQDAKLQNSVYSDDPIFAVFRYLDFTFIVTVVFSLFAILFTYNSINGEREAGTMRLLFSNSIPRSTFISAKFIGSWLGLVIPLSIPILLSLLMLLIFKVPLSIDHWQNIFLLLLISILYLTFFIALGIFVSSLTKYSSTSFLLLLIIWITAIFIVPRVGVMVAAQFVKVPTVAELESQKEAFSKALWEKHFTDMNSIWTKRNEQMQSMNEDDKQTYKENNEYKWFEEDDKLRTNVQREISNYSAKLYEVVRNKRTFLETLALNFSRISPASSYQLATMNLSDSDVNLKDRYEKEIQNYKNIFADYSNKKQKENGSQAGMLRISFDSQSGIKISTGRQDNVLDIKEIPKFEKPRTSFMQTLHSTIIDFGLINLFTLIAYAGAFYSFTKYDLR